MADERQTSRVEQLQEQVNQRVRQAVEEVQRELRERLRRAGDQIVGELETRFGDESPALPDSFLSSDELAHLTEEAAAAARDEARRESVASLTPSLAALDRARNQKGVLDTLVTEAGRFAGRSAVFLVRGDALELWGAHGWDESMDGTRIPMADEGPWSSDSLASGAVDVGSTYCGELCSRVEAPLPGAAVLIPMFLRDQLAAVVYADHGDEDGLASEALQGLTYVAALALESLPFRKRESTPTLSRAATDGSAAAVADEAAPMADVTEPEEAASDEPAEDTLDDASLDDAYGAPSFDDADLGDGDEASADLESADLESGDELSADLGDDTLGGGDDFSYDLEDVAVEEEDDGTGDLTAGDLESDAPELDVAPSLEEEDEEWASSPEAEGFETPGFDIEPESDEAAGEDAGEDTVAEEAAAEPAAEPAEESSADLSPAAAPADTVYAPVPPPPAAATPEPAVTEPEEEDEPAAAEPAAEEPAAEEPEVKPPTTAGGQVAPPSDLDGPGRAFAKAEPRTEEDARHDEARRLARLLVSEIRLYNEDEVDEGRRNNDVYQRLKEDIDRSRQMYEERVDPGVRDSSDYFYDELVRNLAGGDEDALGL